MSKKKLISLEEHNAVARSWGINNNEPVLNGIECPKCGHELYDSRPMVTLTSHPAQKNTHCSNSKCDYVGYRIA